MGFLLYLLLKPLARTPSILLPAIRKCQFLPSPSVLCWRRNQQDDIPGTVIQRSVRGKTLGGIPFLYHLTLPLIFLSVPLRKRQSL